MLLKVGTHLLAVNMAEDACRPARCEWVGAPAVEEAPSARATLHYAENASPYSDAEASRCALTVPAPVDGVRLP